MKSRAVSEEMKESQWDRLLKIRTTGRDDSHSDQYRYPYEPTPYSVLERLADRGYITKRNVLLDYGCGKGRVGFYMAYQVRCRCIGVEYDEQIWKAASENQKSAVSGTKTEIVRGRAEAYVIPPAADRFFFFNPFSVEILQKVMRRILDSRYSSPREILLFFYYPFDAYLTWLMGNESLLLKDEIDCRDLFEGRNDRERILVFEMI